MGMYIDYVGLGYSIIVWGYSAGLLTPEYCLDLLGSDGGSGGSPIPPSGDFVGYVSIDGSSIVVSDGSYVRLFGSDGGVIEYNYGVRYEGLRYYVSGSDVIGIVIDNDVSSGVYIDRADIDGSLCLWNVSGSDIVVSRCDYIKGVSHHSLFYCDGGVRVIGVGGYCELVDGSGDLVLWSDVIDYVGVRYYCDGIDGVSVLFRYSDGVVLGKCWDVGISDFVVSIYNGGSNSIRVSCVECIGCSVSSQRLLAYINDSFRVPTVVSGSVVLVDENDVKTVYDYRIRYIGVRYYVSADDDVGIVIDNDVDGGIYLSRSSDWPCVSIVNGTGSSIVVYSVEYVMELSGHDIAYLLGVSHDSYVSVEDGSYIKLVGSDGSILLYDGSKSYSGIRFNKTGVYVGGCVEMGYDDVSGVGCYIGKIYDVDRGVFELAFYNKLGYCIDSINSIEYYVSDVVRPPEPDGIDGFIGIVGRNYVLEIGVEYLLYDGVGDLLRYDYKQDVIVVGVYDGDSDSYLVSSVSVRCYYDGISWVLALSSLIDGLVISRIKFIASKVSRSKFILGGVMGSDGDIVYEGSSDLYDVMLLDD